ncbi:MAG: phage terminase small subunit P27 family [Magnetococcales bacterium]|nr:phage terminase small subunit P27 family [Magnetococcales bacterium]
MIPDVIKDFPRAYEWWKLLQSDAHFLSNLDVACLEGVCLAMSFAEEAVQMVRDEGTVITLPNGRQKPHPAVSIAREQLELARGLSAALGLTPTSRNRLKAAIHPEAETPGNKMPSPWDKVVF